MSDPRQIILSFLRGLPQTIKTEVLLFIILYAMTVEVPEDKLKFEGLVESYLTKDGTQGISAVLCTVAVVDYSLEGFVSNCDERAERAFATLLEQYPDNANLQKGTSFSSSEEAALGSGVK